MTKRMVVDASHPEETRVAIIDSTREGTRLEDLEFSLASKPTSRGNIYLAKVIRIEPSLQAAFVEYGGNRHGFLSFSEIHQDYYRIPVADRLQAEATASDPALLSASNSPDSDANVQDEMLSVSSDQEALSAVEMGGNIFLPEDNMPEIVAEQSDVSQDLATQSSEVIIPSSNGIDDIQQHQHQTTDETGGAVADLAPITAVGVDENAISTAYTQPNAADIAGESAGATTELSDVSGEAVGEQPAKYVPRPRYKIQDVIRRGQIMLVQVVKEERGGKGAALTTLLSLAGRYCVLMPNAGSHGGGVSRKITNPADRRRMKDTLEHLAVPDGMGVILRTAGMEQEIGEIKRDLDYLMRLWDDIRDKTLQAVAPSLIYEEADLIRCSLRDTFMPDMDEVLVAGVDAFERARAFMQALMPDQAHKIKLYTESVPLFFRYHVERQIDTLHNPIVPLRSGGYLVINPTEALVAIDVNSGRATRERHIEETAFKTNMEAVEEVARQLRLRDLAGLIVVDLIDMEDNRSRIAVENRLKEAMRNDRARVQIGRISLFGLLELSRQRLRPSLLETNFGKCRHCSGTGWQRSVDSLALSVLRAIEEEAIHHRGCDILVRLLSNTALYIFNQKRAALSLLEQRYDVRVSLTGDDVLGTADYKLERMTRDASVRRLAPAVNTELLLADVATITGSRNDNADAPDRVAEFRDDASSSGSTAAGGIGGGRRRSARRGGGNGYNARTRPAESSPTNELTNNPSDGIAGRDGFNDVVGTDSAVPGGELSQSAAEGAGTEHGDDAISRRRRGRRGGRGRKGSSSGSGVRSAYDVSSNPLTPESFSRAPVAEPVGLKYEEQPEATSFLVPISVHDLDTTPRENDVKQGREGSSATQAGAKTSAASPTPSPNERVNPPTDAPRGGWWKRLTGQ